MSNLEGSKDRDVVVFGYGPGWGMSSVCPMSLALETLVLMSGQPCCVSELRRPQASPDGQLPFVQVANQCTAASHWSPAVERLRTVGVCPAAERGLSRAQQALVLAFSDGLLCSRLRAAHRHVFWADEDNFAQCIGPAFSNAVAFPLSWLVRTRQRRRERALAEAAGVDDDRTALHVARRCYDALVGLLGDKAWFIQSTSKTGEDAGGQPLPSEPCSLDALAFGFLCVQLHAPLPHPVLGDLLRSEYPVLVQFVDRVLARWFSPETRNRLAQAGRLPETAAAPPSVRLLPFTVPKAVWPAWHWPQSSAAAQQQWRPTSPQERTFRYRRTLALTFGVAALFLYYITSPLADSPDLFELGQHGAGRALTADVMENGSDVAIQNVEKWYSK